MDHASFEITEFKAVGDGPRGLFAAKVSAFGNIDKNGDRVMPTAFDASIAKLRAKQATIPVIWSHEHRNPQAYIGEVQPQDVHAGKDGLVVAGKLDVDSNPVAAQVFDLLAKGRVKEWSFGYEVRDERIADDLARELLEVDLIEVGPTLRGANGETATLALKEAVAELERLDTKAWDGAAAMRTCNTAAEFRQIAFERANDSDPDTAAHWALPHHDRPGADANPQGVAAALGALSGARGGAPDLVQSVETVRGHLERHRGAEAASAPLDVKLDPIVGEALTRFDQAIDELIEEKIGRVISAKTEARIQRALTALQEVLNDLGQQEVAAEAGSSPETKEVDGEKERLRLQLQDVGSFLTERTW